MKTYGLREKKGLPTSQLPIVILNRRCYGMTLFSNYPKCKQYICIFMNINEDIDQQNELYLICLVFYTTKLGTRIMLRYSSFLNHI